MGPDKVELLMGHPCRITGIEALVDVTRIASDLKLGAYLTAGSASAHRVEYPCGTEVEQEVADEEPATITGVATIAEIARGREMVEACQAGNGARCNRGLRKPGVSRRLIACECGIDDSVDLRCCHGVVSFRVSEGIPSLHRRLRDESQAERSKAKRPGVPGRSK